MKVTKQRAMNAMINHNIYPIQHIFPLQLLYQYEVVSPTNHF